MIFGWHFFPSLVLKQPVGVAAVITPVCGRISEIRGRPNGAEAAVLILLSLPPVPGFLMPLLDFNWLPNRKGLHIPGEKTSQEPHMLCP